MTAQASPRAFPLSPVAAGLLLAIGIMIADQATKWGILHLFANGPRTIEILPFLNIVLVWNTGVSFGLFSSGERWILIGLVCLIAAGLTFWLFRIDRRPLALAVGSVIGGAIGNVIDRIVHGAVVDFVDIYVGDWHWPAFNVADSAIVIGAGLLLLDSLFAEDKSPKKDAEDG
ncbi:MAG: signal peptidase II [Magnetospiraceae bacterium]